MEQNASYTLKESCLKWSKEVDAEGKHRLGKESIALGIDLCINLAQCDNVGMIESSCKVLSYPLANCSKMDEGSSLRFFHAFCLLLKSKVEVLEMRQIDSLAKCTTHFSQGISQLAVKMGRQDSPIVDIHQVSHGLYIALLPEVAEMMKRVITAENFAQLLTYTVDAAISLASRIDLNESSPGSVKKSVETSSSATTSSTSVQVTSASKLRSHVLDLVARPELTEFTNRSRIFDLVSNMHLFMQYMFRPLLKLSPLIMTFYASIFISLDMLATSFFKGNKAPRRPLQNAGQWYCFSSAANFLHGLLFYKTCRKLCIDGGC